MTLEKIAAILKNYLEKNTPVIIGVSGGIDSIVLLFLLFELKYANVTVAHVDHMIRSTAQDDALFVAQLAKKMGYEFREIQCDILKLSADTKDSIENCGRKVRYAFFEELRAQVGNGIIMTAHHADDLLESRMMHLLRGSNLRGLEGMKIFDKKRHVLRPLLKVNKEELLDYAREKNLEWKEDYTNEDTSFTRNKIRHDLLPVCIEINPAFEKVIERFTQNALEIEDFLSAELHKRIGSFDQQTFDYTRIAELPKVLLNEFFAVILREKDPLFTLTTAHIDNIRVQFEHLHSGKSICLSPRIKCTRSFDTVTIHNITEVIPPADTAQEYDFLPERFVFNGYYCSISDSLSTIQILKESVSQGIMIRFPKAGDRVLIVHKEKEFHKPLKKYFIEHKIPVDLRQSTPVVIARSTGEVIALLGMQTLVHNTQKPCIYLTCRHG